MKEPGSVMLIDDDVDDRYLFCNAAAAENPDVLCIAVEGGKEAFSKLNALDELPGVIFLDINMPGMSGWQVLRQIKNTDSLKDIPILMYSTSSSERDVSMAGEFGAIGYCVKPNNSEDLSTILKYVFAHLGEDLGRAIRENRIIANLRYSPSLS